MGIDLPYDSIRPPSRVCPSRPIFGFSPTPLSTTTLSDEEDRLHEKTRKSVGKKRTPSLRQEVSGKRVYVDWAMNTFDSAEAFFNEFYIHPYCPLQFLTKSGANITPDELPRNERNQLYSVCDRYLKEIIELFRPLRIVSIGNFAEERLNNLLHRLQSEGGEGIDPTTFVVGKIPHPRYPLETIIPT